MAKNSQVKTRNPLKVLFQFCKNFPLVLITFWLKINEIILYSVLPKEEEEKEEYLTLEVLENWKAFTHGGKIEEVSGMASGEEALEIMMRKVEEQWKVLEFILINHRDTKDVFILGSVEEIQV